MRCLECCSAVHCCGPYLLQQSTNIAALLRAAASVWDLRLQFGQLAPLCIINKAHHCDTVARSLVRRNVCICRMFCSTSYVIKVLILWSRQRPFLRLCIHNIYRVSKEERTKLREGVPYVKVYRYNPKHLYPKLNGYGDNGKRSLKL